MSIKIIIADDHQVVRLGLRALLQEVEGLEVVAEARDGIETIEQVDNYSPDVVLIDIRMPKMSGINACSTIKKHRPETKVIILTSYSDNEEIHSAILAGADAYLLKEIGTNNLIETIQDVYAGNSVVDPSITKKILENYRVKNNTKPHEELLSPQEHLILSFVAQGKTNKEIAYLLKLSEKTIRNYISNILSKLGLKNRTAAAAYAIKNKLI